MNRLTQFLHFITDSSTKDSAYLLDLVAALDRMIKEFDEVDQIFSGDLENRTVLCMKACQEYVADPTSQNKKKMRALWTRLDECEKRDIARIAVAKTDESRLGELRRVHVAHAARTATTPARRSESRRSLTKRDSRVSFAMS